jgi:hypothetical protein
MTGRWEVRGSISAYYHSSVRDVFVGVLVTIGFFLVTYHVATRAYVSRTTTLAGVLAVGVALFPTMTEGSTPTVLQTWFPGGPETVRVIHFLCAIPFLILLAFISGWFGQDADRGEDPGSPDVPPLPPPAGQRAFPWADPGPWTRWGRFHRVCGAVILIALVCIPLLNKWGFEDSMFYGEAVAVIAFSLSWLTRGLAHQAIIIREVVPDQLLPAHLRTGSSAATITLPGTGQSADRSGAHRDADDKRRHS